MSKSKKNTIDPETMIKLYGADAVRWFILSDSPPEKDVQWSDVGVVSASKFLQKILNLNQLILNNKETNTIKKDEENFKIKIETYIYKIDKAINNFQLNVVVANIYGIYNLFNAAISEDVCNKVLKKNLSKNILYQDALHQ